MSPQHIIMIKNQHKKSLLKSLTEHAQDLPSNLRYYKKFNKGLKSYACEFIHGLRHKNKFKKVAYKRLGPEFNKYFHKKGQEKINKEIKNVCSCIYK